MNRTSYQLNGIQQIGIGVKDLESSWKWYRKAFGMDIPIFQDKAEAKLMARYTGGQIFSRHAVLAMNLQGGGGFEIWQYTDRTPIAPVMPVQWGDLGIFAVKIRSRNVEKSRSFLEKIGAKVLTSIRKQPDGGKSFFIRDPFDNVFEICECDQWFSSSAHLHGGVKGVCIGVTDSQKSQRLYRDILGFSRLEYQQEELTPDWNGGLVKSKRMLLGMEGKNPGAFGALLCSAQVELVETIGRSPSKIFENRFWGDLGFIHFCLDVNGLNSLREKCDSAGFPVTVDSQSSFDMGKAAGHFCYVEDPDNTLVEMVETHRVPIFERFNWYLNLKKRDSRKNLPSILVRMLGLNRVRN